MLGESTIIRILHYGGVGTTGNKDTSTLYIRFRPVILVFTVCNLARYTDNVKEEFKLHAELQSFPLRTSIIFAELMSTGYIHI